MVSIIVRTGASMAQRNRSVLAGAVTSTCGCLQHRASAWGCHWAQARTEVGFSCFPAGLGLTAGFSGCHRFEAHQRLGLPTIRCRVRRVSPSILKSVPSAAEPNSSSGACRMGIAHVEDEVSNWWCCFLQLLSHH